MVTCVEDLKVVYMNYENYPDFNILEAIKISISIPLYFTSTKINNKNSF